MLPIKDNIPSHRKPFINYLIILINTCVFIYQIFLSPQEEIIFVRIMVLFPKDFYSTSLLILIQS
jgi:membrane associated rhomboid family serine protease